MSKALSYCLELISKGTALSYLLASKRDVIFALIAVLSPASINSCSSPDYSSIPSLEINSPNPFFSARPFAFLMAPAFLYSLIDFSIKPFF